MKRPILGLLSLVLVLGACSLGPREEYAEAIEEAHDRALDAGTARVEGFLKLDVIESVARSRPEPITEKVTGVVDFVNSRSRLVGQGEPKLDLYVDDTVLILPRSAADEGDDPFIRIDFRDEPEEDIGVQDRRFAVGFPGVSPSLAVEMLQGVLTGSIELEGDEEIAGAATSHYSARMTSDAALRELDDEDREEAVARLLETMGITAEIIDFEVWLDAEGRPRQVRYIFEQRQDRVNRFRFTYRLVFSDFGTAANVELPSEAEETDDFQRFVTEFVRERVEF